MPASTAASRNAPPIQAIADTRYGVSHVKATTSRQPDKMTKKRQAPKIAAANSAVDQIALRLL